MSNLLKRKIKALADFLDIPEKEIEYNDEAKALKAYGEFYTPNGVFTVMTEEEAYAEHLEYTENFIDDLGIEGFPKEFQEQICQEFIDQQPFEEFCYDDYIGYSKDIEWEKHDTHNTKYANRLIDECVEAGLIKEAEIDENGDYTGKSDLIELLSNYIVDDIRSEYRGDFALWYLDTFGKDSFMLFIKETNCHFDIKGISEVIVDEYGFGHSLANWDGETNEQDDFFIFKQNDKDYRS